MNKNLEKLLCNLEPEINKKCFEIKEKKREKMMQRLFILASIQLLIIPSLLIIIGISILSMLIGIVSFTQITLVVMLPLAIKEERGVCYE